MLEREFAENARAATGLKVRKYVRLFPLQEVMMWLLDPKGENHSPER